MALFVRALRFVGQLSAHPLTSAPPPLLSSSATRLRNINVRAIHLSPLPLRADRTTLATQGHIIAPTLYISPPPTTSSPFEIPPSPPSPSLLLMFSPSNAFRYEPICAAVIRTPSGADRLPPPFVFALPFNLTRFRHHKFKYLALNLSALKSSQIIDVSSWKPPSMLHIASFILLSPKIQRLLVDSSSDHPPTAPAPVPVNPESIVKRKRTHHDPRCSPLGSTSTSIKDMDDAHLPH
ncbi:hypothetical protein R3P38DRAFT_3262406 [Favolaschia claudopus]|uniref:Uncharacterized protein n=1 Tax=Favolaschia claudopus TaxID=2862362 RepID=A0AAW0CIP5_9AGAR